MVFAGPTDDPFWVDLGSIFDLLSLRPQAAPVGYEGGPSQGIDGLAGFNVHSIAFQVPIDRVLKGAGNNTVIGVWATSSRPVRACARPRQETRRSATRSRCRGWAIPLVNEVVLPLALKDAFNGLKPNRTTTSTPADTDAGELLGAAVLRPELETLAQRALRRAASARACATTWSRSSSPV